MNFRYFLVVLFCTSNWNIAKSENKFLDWVSSGWNSFFGNNGVNNETLSDKPLPIPRQSACSSKSLVIINSHRKNITFTISMENTDTLKLSEVREIFIEKKYMDETEHFLNSLQSTIISTISVINKNSEPEIYVCDIMNKVEDNKYLLVLGHTNLHPQQEIANRYLYGIILDKNGEFKVSNEIIHKIALLTDNNLPAVELIGNLVMVNTVSSTTESDENEKTLAVGASIHASINYGVVHGSSSVNGELSNAKHSKQERESVHITNKIFNLKERISLDKNKIISSNWFRKNVFSIMKSDKDIHKVGAKLIEFLNKYGWYFPVDYIVGGAIFKSTVRNKITVEDAYKVATSIGTDLMAKIIFDGEGGAKFNYSDSSNMRHGFVNENSQDILTSFGAGGALNIEEFQQKIEKNENWIILQYNKLIPSLGLFYNDYPYQFGQIHRLFLNMYTMNSLQKLQPFINYKNYASELVSFSEYVTDNVN